ncbi:MAG: MBL fold metallo-hydrolase [Desulfovibrionaceae bacterium]|nr:MBL fold metallo-hydrolase [Desulfovibrionaceae bacterium]
MKRMFPIVCLMLAFCLFTLPAGARCADGEDGISVRLVRNATLKISHGGTTVLLDPMLAGQGAWPGFAGTYHSELRNPTVPLPMPVSEVLQDVDAVILTHTHEDHWDRAAQELLPKGMPVYVQNEADRRLVSSQGFTDVRVLKQSDRIGAISLARTACRHGSETVMADESRRASLDPVMGMVFSAPGVKSVYVAADTVWFKGVEEALALHRPDVIVLNTGAASLSGERYAADPRIIMDKEDVLRACQAAPSAKIVTVHMDAVNHMTTGRADVRAFCAEKGLTERVLIPMDGETMDF